jgi:hypothetical protein
MAVSAYKYMPVLTYLVCMYRLDYMYQCISIKIIFLAVPENYFSAEFRSVPSFGMGSSAEFGIPLE